MEVVGDALKATLEESPYLHPTHRIWSVLHNILEVVEVMRKHRVVIMRPPYLPWSRTHLSLGHMFFLAYLQQFGSNNEHNSTNIITNH